MRRLALAVLVVALLTMPTMQAVADASVDAHTEVEAPGSTSLELRRSIVIEGDDELANHSAVRGGNGTADDPYRIANWTIVSERTTAIELRGTSAHVVLENLTFRPMIAGGGNAFLIQQADDVTIRNVHIRTLGDGIIASETRNLTVERAHITSPNPAVVGSDGIGTAETKDTLIRNVTVSEVINPIALTNDEGIEVEHLTARMPQQMVGENTDSASFAVQRNLTVRHSVFDGVSIQFDQFVGESRNVSLVENVVVNASQGIDFTEGQTWRDVSVCGNTIRNITGTGLVLETNVPNIESTYHVSRNRFLGNEVPFEIDPTRETTIARNLVANSTVDGFTASSGDASIHNNSFVNNAGVHFIVGDLHDVRDNWWGHPEGPSGDFEGGGEPLYWDAEDPSVDPLEQPPALSFDCIPGDAVGDQHESARPLVAKAQVGIEVGGKQEPMHAEPKGCASSHSETASLGPLSREVFECCTPNVKTRSTNR